MVLNNKKCAGFTILEVVITIGILSIVLLSATKLLASYIKTSQEIGVSGDYTENLRIASNQIMDQVKKANTAKSVRVENDDKQLFINDQLILDAEKKASNTNNAQLWLYDRGADGAELRIKDGTNSRVLAAYIERITIEPLPAEKYLNVIIEVKDTKPATISIPKTYAFASILEENPEQPQEPEEPNAIWGDFVTYSNQLLVENANISGDAIVYVADNTYDFKIKNSDTKIWTSSIYINQDIAELDNATLGADRNSSIYVNGNITVKNPPPKINGSLYHTGSIKNSQGQDIERTISNAYKRDSIDFPDVHMPLPHQDPSKYQDYQAYNYNTRLISGKKYKGNSILIRDYHVEDIIIYSTGSNTISIENSGTFVSGILYAPGGTVYIRDAKFEGIIIANKIEVWNSSASVKFRPFEVKDLPFTYQE